MRKSRFNDEQIAAIRRESDRTPVAEAAKRHKVRQRSGVREARDPGHFPGMIDSKKRTQVILASTLRR